MNNSPSYHLFPGASKSHQEIIKLDDNNNLRQYEQNINHSQSNAHSDSKKFQSLFPSDYISNAKTNQGSTRNTWYSFRQTHLNVCKLISIDQYPKSSLVALHRLCGGHDIVRVGTTSQMLVSESDIP
jgi:hypothetical protein